MITMVSHHWIYHRLPILKPATQPSSQPAWTPRTRPPQPYNHHLNPKPAWTPTTQTPPAPWTPPANSTTEPLGLHHSQHGTTATSMDSMPPPKDRAPTATHPSPQQSWQPPVQPVQEQPTPSIPPPSYPHQPPTPPVPPTPPNISIGAGQQPPPPNWAIAHGNNRTAISKSFHGTANIRLTLGESTRRS